MPLRDWDREQVWLMPPSLDEVLADDHPARLVAALQAVDGTKVAGSASSSRTYDARQLERLLARTERAIADLEAQNEAGDEPAAPRLPADLAEAQRLRAEVLAARQALAAGERRHVNLTDPDARLLRAAGGYLTGYNAQAMAVTVRYERRRGWAARGRGQ